MFFFLQILGGIAGASLASAVQCGAERYLVSENWFKEWATGRSVCDRCGRELKWYQLVPVLSYLVSRGRTSCCGTRLIPLYLLMEMVGAALGFLAVGDALSENWHGVVVTLLVGFVGIIGFTTDYKGMHLPVWPIGLTAMVLVALNPSAQSAWGVVVGIGIIGFLYVITKGKGMGSGDIVLAALLGALVGFPLIIPNLVVAFVAGAIVATGLLIRKQSGLKDQLPFGIFLIPLLWIHLCVPNWLDWLVAVYGLG